MESRKFGARLRQLRTQAGMRQRELADAVGIDFTYLSKIESGAMPPPSEKVILQLAQALHTDKDELLILAGKLPSDIAQLLSGRGMLRLLRSIQIGRGMLKTTNQKRRGLQATVTNLFQNFGTTINRQLIHPLTLTVIAFAKPKHHYKRIGTAVASVLAVAALLWLAAPTKALEITYPSLPSTGVLGATYSFTFKITIEDSELLPIESVNLDIFNSASPTTYKATATNLPLTSATSSYTNAQTGGGAVTVSATAESSWGYGYGYGYASWGGYGYTFFSPGGYGYGYGYSAGATSITYAVTWTPPVSWPTGGYNAKATVTANGTTFTQTSSQFTLSAGGGIAGQATLQSRGAAPGNDWITPATVHLWTVGANRTTATPIATYSVTTSTTGTFEITGISPANYDITIKGSHTLRNLIENRQISAGASTTVNFGTLTEGDGWGPSSAPDNVVDISDYSAILYSFGATSASANWIETCDFNEDGVVDVSDYSIVLYNFGQAGVAPF